jgi:hypothetical protein
VFWMIHNVFMILRSLSGLCSWMLRFNEEWRE